MTPKRKRRKRDVAKEWLVPKMNPLLAVQLVFYGMALLVFLGLVWTKTVKPGLAVYGIKVIMPSDTTADHGNRIEANEAKVECLERGIARLETVMRAVLKKIAPEALASLPAPMDPEH